MPTMDPAFLCATPVRVAPHHGAAALSPRRARHMSAARCARATLEAPASGAAAVDVAWPDAAALSKSGVSGAPVMDINAIMNVLPHRYPFLLLDKVVALEAGKRAIGVKSVTVNEPFFPGHFPARPIMPGVLQVEAMAQLCGIVMLQPPISDGSQEFFFGGVDAVRWRRPVVPGDTLVMEVALKTFKRRFGIAKMTAKGYVDGKLAVEGELTLAMVVDK